MPGTGHAAAPDVVVVGAGLAGLCAGVRLAEGGARVLVVAKGVGGLPLSSGTVDVLGYAPHRVASPAGELPAFARSHPGHPYALLAGRVPAAVEWFRGRVPGIGLVGSTERNMLLPTAVGVARPTALAPASMAAGDVAGGGRVVVAGLRAFRDLHPALVAANLARAALPGGAGVSARPVLLDASPRPETADVGATVFAQAFDDPGFRGRVAAELGPQVRDGEAVGLPAVIGLDGAPASWAALQEAVGAQVFEIGGLPPSVPGLRMYRALGAALRAAGGRLVLGPSAVSGEAAGGRLTGVVVRQSGRRRAYPAGAVVLATGGLAAGGIELDSHGHLHETVLGLPVDGPPAGAPGTLTPAYLDPQPLMAAGLRVDAHMRPLGPGGEPVYENLHAAGDVLAGAAPWRDGTGEGIAIASSDAAAHAILGAS